MSSPFESILSGSDRSLVIDETSFFIAVLEKKPLVLGHVILISKKSEDDLFHLSDEALANLMPFAKKIAKAIQKAVVCKKVGTAVIGLETKHAHVHLVPIQSADDLNFTRPKLSPEPAEIERVFREIKGLL